MLFSVAWGVRAGVGGRVLVCGWVFGVQVTWTHASAFAYPAPAGCSGVLRVAAKLIRDSGQSRKCNFPVLYPSTSQLRNSFLVRMALVAQMIGAYVRMGSMLAMHNRV